MKNFKNFIKESVDHKTLEEAKKSKRDIDVLKYISYNNLFEQEKDLVEEYANKLSTYYYEDLLYDIDDDDMLLFILSFIDLRRYEQSIGLMREYHSKKRSDYFYKKIWDYDSSLFNRKLSITDTWDVSMIIEIFELIKRIGKVDDYFSKSESIEKNGVLLSVLDFDDAVKNFNILIDKYDIKDVGRLLISFGRSIYGERRNTTLKILKEILITSDKVKKIALNRKISICKRLKDNEVNEILFPKITPAQYIKIFKKEYGTWDNFSDEQIDYLIDIFKKRSKKQLSSDVSALLSTKLVNEVQIDKIMNILIDDGLIDKKNAGDALKRVLMYTHDYIFKYGNMDKDLYSFIRKLLEMKPDNLLDVIYNTYSRHYATKLKAVVYNNQKYSGKFLDFWNMVLTYVPDFSNADFLIYSRLKKTNISKYIPEVIKDWEIKEKWNTLLYQKLSKNNIDPHDYNNEIQDNNILGLIKYKDIKITWEDGEDGIDEWIENYIMQQNMGKYKI